jgi:hypothetical protein
MSARHEEQVHALAASLDDSKLLDTDGDVSDSDRPMLVTDREQPALPAPDQTDGAI